MTEISPLCPLKEDLQGHHNASDDEPEWAVRGWLWKQNVDFFCDGFKKLVHHWQECVQLSGDYVEKLMYEDKGQILRIIFVFGVLKYSHPNTKYRGGGITLHSTYRINFDKLFDNLLG